MIPKATIPCDACNARGIVPRSRRMIEGAPDPFDTREEELCSKCGGSGRVAAPGPAPDPIPVAAIDHGDCCG